MDSRILSGDRLALQPMFANRAGYRPHAAAKRALDLLLALLILLSVFPWLALVTALMHAIQSPGPLLFCQIRSGLHGRPFRIYKFRTMQPGHGQEATQATQDDSRVFAFGRFMRRFSLDEIPQIINVLRGEMSFVGPRPHLSQHDMAFAMNLPRYQHRHSVLPGITGLAQVSGARGETPTINSARQRLELDLAYLENCSFWLDLQILAKTVCHMISPPRQAY